jgi:hypothetical protein
VRKLQSKGCGVSPLQGVTLTEEGERSGRAVCAGALWTVSGRQKTWPGAGPAAEVAECAGARHAQRCDRPLDDFLGNPRVTPPVGTHSLGQHAGAYPVAVPLTALATGWGGHVCGIAAAAPIRDFLHQQGLQVGTPTTVLSIAESGERLLEMGVGRRRPASQREPGYCGAKFW